MKAKVVFWTNLAAGLALLYYVLHTAGGPALDVLRREPSLPLLALFVAMVAATVLTLSWRWRFILATLHPPPSLWTLALHRSAAHSLALLVPSGKLGGDPLRAWLAVRSGVPAESAIASVAVDRTLEIGATAPFSIFFVSYLLQQGVPRLEQALVTIAIATLGLGVGVVIAVRRLRRGKGLVTAMVRWTNADRFRIVGSQVTVIEAAERAMTELAARPGRMAIAFAVGLLANLLVMAEVACLLLAFALPSDPTAVIAALFATAAAHMAPIPAGVGVLEGAQMWIFQMLGYPEDVGLAVGLAVRFRDLVWMAPGILYLLGRSLGTSVNRMREAQ